MILSIAVRGADVNFNVAYSSIFTHFFSSLSKI